MAMRYMEERIDLREFFLETAVDLPEQSCILSIGSDGFHDTIFNE
ncbi:MAG: hypothetical protein ACFFDN_32245 [Candidatus Hodarchaeota archaeon]